MQAERTTERKYALTKVSPGDYLLPSNDGATLWRIARGREEDLAQRQHEVWQVWRWQGRFDPDRLPDDLLDWSHWDLHNSWCESRAEAIKAAMRHA